MRARIEVYEAFEYRRHQFDYTVDMAIGPYGRYIQVAKGSEFSADEAEQQAMRDARDFVKQLNKINAPIIKKYVNITGDENETN